MSLLETEGLGKDYGRATAVRALDLAVEQGEIFGLLGPNGAGKTTAISMICGVLTPSRGSARIGGHDIGAEPMAARRQLGLVPQELALYEDLSARQNLSFFGAMYGLGRAELTGRIGWALEVAGLAARAEQPVKRFSGGMKRRLNLAAGLMHRPRLLVLDEPTVGVDAQSRNYLFETIRSLNREHRVTVLYTSHYMEEVELLCDRVAILDEGELIAADTLDGLVARFGGGAMQIRFDGDDERVAAALAGLGEARVSDGRARVVPREGIAAVARAMEQAGATLHELRALDDLESIFLDLTGKRLRDD